MADQDGLYIGLMSGTSADAIDAALCRFAPRTQVLATHALPWPGPLRKQLLALAQDEARVDLDHLGRLDTAIGRCMAAAVQALLRHAGLTSTEIRAIGSHGQTVRHRPQGPDPFTLQLGDPWVLAERTGIDTVADFRRADVAAGGQGAPLMPAFHAAILAQPGRARAVLNLGGIANLTLLAADGAVRGFDTGPANAMLDAWCQRQLGQAFDHDGALAARGQVHTPLLDELLRDAYFAAAPPKSTGREYFHLAWLDAHLARLDRAPAVADVQATLLALTVASVQAAIEQHAPAAREVLVCGGGVHNRVLMQALAAALAPRPVSSSAELGIDPDHVEAAGFAWLARQHVLGLPGNLPAVTGARGPRRLGSLCPAPRI